MKRQSLHLRASALTLIVGWAFTAQADDLNPPPWRLSGPDATVQEWDFKTPTKPLAPDGNIWGSGGGGFVNPFGTPQLTTGTTSPWTPSFAGRSGVYTLASPNDVIDFGIPNEPSGQGQKKMWIQISTFNGGTIFTPDVFISSSSFNGPATVVGSFFMADGWQHITYSVDMNTCPEFEQVHITNFSPVVMGIDEVVIDTICVPEPCTVVALGAAAFALVRRRRR